jgi:hypothetical protein
VSNCSFTHNSAGVDNEVHSHSAPFTLTLTASHFTLLPPSQLNRSSFSVALNVAGAALHHTALQCPPGYEVYHADRLYGCQHCHNQYSLEGGVAIDDQPITECLPCPFGRSEWDCALLCFLLFLNFWAVFSVGADCRGGDAVYAVRGFWSGGGAPELYFVPCQLGHCCADADSCPWQSVCR